MLASTSDDGSVAVWDLRSQSISQIFPGHASAALGPLFSPDGQTVYAAGDDGSVIAWDIGGDRSLGRPFRFASHAAAHAKNTPTGGASTAVAVSLSGRYFATSPRSGVVTLWRANNLHKVGELHGPRGFVKALAFSHDDRKLAAVLESGATGRTLVWKLASHTLIRKLGSSRQAVPHGVAFSPDDQLLATAGLDGLARVYRLHNGRLIGSDQLNGSLVNVDFSPDGRFLAAASLSGQIDIWNVGRRTVTQTIEHGRAVFSLSFLPDSTLATGDNYGNIDFWNPETGRPLPGTLGQSEPVVSLSADRTGDRLLTLSTQGKLRLWDLATRKLIGAPLTASDNGGNAALSPDGHYALGTFATGNGIIWDTNPASWRTRACRIANGNLTQVEWRDFLPSLRGRRVCT